MTDPTETEGSVSEGEGEWRGDFIIKMGARFTGMGVEGEVVVDTGTTIVVETEATNPHTTTEAGTEVMTGTKSEMGGNRTEGTITTDVVVATATTCHLVMPISPRGRTIQGWRATT